MYICKTETYLNNTNAVLFLDKDKKVPLLLNINIYV